MLFLREILAKVCLFVGKPLSFMIFTNFDEFLKASKALDATEQCFFFGKSCPKSVYLAGVF